MKYGVLNDQWGTDNNATDVILMRVEEMYLIKAEAQAMSGNVSGGVSTLNSLSPRIVIPLISVPLLHRRRRKKLFGNNVVLNSGEKVWHISISCV